MNNPIDNTPAPAPISAPNAEPAAPAPVSEPEIPILNPDDFFYPDNTPTAAKPKPESDENFDEPTIPISNPEIDSLKEQTRVNNRLIELGDILTSKEYEYLTPYKDQLKKIIVDKGWGNLKTENIIYAALGKNIMKIGAEREKAAKNTQIRNGSVGNPQTPNVDTAPNFNSMDANQLAAWTKSKMPNAKF